MLNRIFRKRGAADKGKGLRARATAPSSVQKTVPADEAVSQVDITVDEGIATLHSLLSELPRIEVAPAAKERCWATMQRELERHPVRQVASAARKGVASKPVLNGAQVRTATAGHSGHTRGRRVALGSMAAVAMVIIAVLGGYGAGLFTADGPGTTVTVVMNTSETTGTSTSSATSETTPSTGGTTTETTPATSSTDNTTTVTTGTSTTGGTQGSTTTSGGTAGTNSSTTVPTTTDVTQVANREYEKKALDVALDLGAAVCQGDLALARSLVASSAQGALTQMVLTLIEPNGSQQVGVKTLTSSTVRITLEFTDIDPETTDTNGQPKVIHPRFNLTIQVDANGATIIGISRGS